MPWPTDIERLSYDELRGMTSEQILEHFKLPAEWAPSLPVYEEEYGEMEKLLGERRAGAERQHFEIDVPRFEERRYELQDILNIALEDIGGLRTEAGGQYEAAGRGFTKERGQAGEQYLMGRGGLRFRTGQSLYDVMGQQRLQAGASGFAGVVGGQDLRRTLRDVRRGYGRELGVLGKQRKMSLADIGLRETETGLAYEEELSGFKRGETAAGQAHTYGLSQLDWEAEREQERYEAALTSLEEEQVGYYRQFGESVYDMLERLIEQWEGSEEEEEEEEDQSPPVKPPTKPLLPPPIKIGLGR